MRRFTINLSRVLIIAGLLIFSKLAGAEDSCRFTMDPSQPQNKLQKILKKNYLGQRLKIDQKGPENLNPTGRNQITPKNPNAPEVFLLLNSECYQCHLIASEAAQLAPFFIPYANLTLTDNSDAAKPYQVLQFPALVAVTGTRKSFLFQPIESTEQLWQGMHRLLQFHLDSTRPLPSVLKPRGFNVPVLMDPQQSDEITEYKIIEFDLNESVDPGHTPLVTSEPELQENG